MATKIQKAKEKEEREAAAEKSAAGLPSWRYPCPKDNDAAKPYRNEAAPQRAKPSQTMRGAQFELNVTISSIRYSFSRTTQRKREESTSAAATRRKSRFRSQLMFKKINIRVLQKLV